MRRETRVKRLSVLMAALCLVGGSATVTKAGASFLQSATTSVQRQSASSVPQLATTSVQRQPVRSVLQPATTSVQRQPVRSVLQPATTFVQRQSVRSVRQPAAKSVQRQSVRSAPQLVRSAPQPVRQFLGRVRRPYVVRQFDPPEGPYDLNAVHMADADRGWAVGDDGIILKTRDGGRTWIHQSSRTSEDLRGVDSFDGQIVYAVGEGNTLLRTEDGGRNWSDPRRYGSGYRWNIKLTDVYLLSHDTAIVVGGTSRGPSSSYDIYGYVATFLRTIDGGLTWTTPSYPGDLEQINAVDFMDDQVGIAVGGSLTYRPTGTSSIVARTEDGGITWSKKESPFGSHTWAKIVEDVAFHDDVHATIVATGGVPIALSADEGHSWTTARGSICGFEEQSITYVDTDTLVAVGESSIIRSIDSGLRWETVHSIEDETCYCLKSVSAAEMTVVAVGCNSQILRSDDGGATWEEVSP